MKKLLLIDCVSPYLCSPLERWGGGGGRRKERNRTRERESEKREK